MARFHAFEFHELGFFPATWRDLLTELMSFYARLLHPYRHVAPMLAEALEDVGGNRIVDLCSGAGSPLLSLLPVLEETLGGRLEVVLTDKFPNVGALRALADDSGGAIKTVLEPVDAMAVPPELRGFRTIFTAFHHFRESEARAILEDAVRLEQGIGIFEYTERNFLIWTLPLLLTPLAILFATPFVRPFRFSRLLWTYLIPVVPFAALWDGFASCLRTYSTGELWKLTESLGASNYAWRIGRVPSLGASHVTFLIGTPEGG